MNTLTIREVDIDDKSDLQEFARHYAEATARRREGPPPTATDVIRNMSWLRYNRDRVFCLFAEDDDGDVLAHYLLYFDDFSPTKTCFVKSLWIDASSVRRDLAERFDTLGEDWAREKGARKVVSRVPTDNPRLIEMNSLQGFRAVKLEMEKDL